MALCGTIIVIESPVSIASFQKLIDHCSLAEPKKINYSGLKTLRSNNKKWLIFVLIFYKKFFVHLWQKCTFILKREKHSKTCFFSNKKCCFRRINMKQTYISRYRMRPSENMVTRLEIQLTRLQYKKCWFRLRDLPRYQPIPLKVLIAYDLGSL